MELAHFLRVLRTQWALICACVAVCVLVAGGLAALSDPVYEARTQLFVAGGESVADLDQTYEGALLAQQRARSYAHLVSSPGVARAVIDRLGLEDAPDDIQRRLAASVPVDTVLIDVTASAPSARRAKLLADAAGVVLPRYVAALERTPGEREPPLKLSVASRPELPTAPASPRTAVYLALGLLLGLALGVSAAVLRDALDDRVRTDDQAAAAAGVPVIGGWTDRSPGDRREIAESHRRLRANLAAPAAKGSGRLLMTSVGAEHDSARAVAGLGGAFAEAGQSVVLVDANVWRSRLGELLAVPLSPGLTDVLLNDVSVENALQPSGGGPAVELLPAGEPVVPASDVLSGRRLADALDSLSVRADVVILDSPALDAATDATVLAPLTSGVLLVARLSSTRASQLDAAVRELRAVRAEILGLVTIRPNRSSAWRWRNGGRERAFASVAASPIGAGTGGGR